MIIVKFSSLSSNKKKTIEIILPPWHASIQDPLWTLKNPTGLVKVGIYALGQKENVAQLHRSLLGEPTVIFFKKGGEDESHEINL